MGRPRSGSHPACQGAQGFIGDIYDKAEILKDGVVTRDLILGSSQFRRAAVGIKPPLGVFVTVAGIDLVRGENGRFYVLEDNARTPSGVSYALENRYVMACLMPDLIRTCRLRSVEGYPADLLTSLTEIAPAGISRPTVVVLTPGPYNSAFFEHVFLSQQMGVELVEGEDLVCVDHKVFMKTVHGLTPVHVNSSQGVAAKIPGCWRPDASPSRRQSFLGGSPS